MLFQQKKLPEDNIVEIEFSTDEDNNPTKINENEKIESPTSKDKKINTPNEISSNNKVVNSSEESKVSTTTKNVTINTEKNEYSNKKIIEKEIIVDGNNSSNYENLSNKIINTNLSNNNENKNLEYETIELKNSIADPDGKDDLVKKDDTNIVYISGMIIGAVLFFVVGNFIVSKRSTKGKNSENGNFENDSSINKENKVLNINDLENNMDVIILNKNIDKMDNRNINSVTDSNFDNSNRDYLELGYGPDTSFSMISIESMDQISQMDPAYIVDNSFQGKNVKKIYSIKRFIKKYSFSNEFYNKNKLSINSSLFQISFNGNSEI